MNVNVIHARGNKKIEMSKRYYKDKIKEHIENCESLKELQYLEAFVRLHIDIHKEV